MVYVKLIGRIFVGQEARQLKLLFYQSRRVLIIIKVRKVGFLFNLVENNCMSTIWSKGGLFFIKWSKVKSVNILVVDVIKIEKRRRTLRELVPVVGRIWKCQALMTHRVHVKSLTQPTALRWYNLLKLRCDCLLKLIVVLVLSIGWWQLHTILHIPT